MLAVILCADPLPKKNLLSRPLMGWNSWNTFHGDISEELIRQTADLFVSLGLKDLGYEYVVIDDGYLLKERDAQGKLQPDVSKFPSNSFKPLADYIHGLGLKFGMYNCAGTKTCMGFAGSLGHEESDAKQFASWDIDFLKYDFCNNPIVNQRWAPDITRIEFDEKSVDLDRGSFQGKCQFKTDRVINIGDGDNEVTYTLFVDDPSGGNKTITIGYINPSAYRLLKVSVNGATADTYMFAEPSASGNVKDSGVLKFTAELRYGPNELRLFFDGDSTENDRYSYQRMGDELIKSGRNIVFSLCEWGSHEPWTWGPEIGHAWRTTLDINSVQNVADWKQTMRIYETNVVLDEYAGKNHYNDPDMLVVGLKEMTHIKDVTHFSLWSIMAAPLVIGADLRNISSDALAVLKNVEVIKVNQDGLNVQARRVFSEGNRDVLAKPLADGGVAVLLFNKDGAAAAEVSYRLNLLSDEIAMQNPERWKNAGAYVCRDLWAATEETVTDSISKTLQPWEVYMGVCNPA